MRVPLDDSDVRLRYRVLNTAIALTEDQEGRRETGLVTILDRAELIYRWITTGSEDTVRLVILTGRPYEQGRKPPLSKGVPHMSVTLTDTQQVDVSVQPVDSKGNATDDSNLTWTVDDTSVVSVVGADDGDPKTITLVAGNPGVTNVTVTDGTITGVEAVVVTAGATASFTITEGTPAEQAPAV